MFKDFHPPFKVFHSPISVIYVKGCMVLIWSADLDYCYGARDASPSGVSCWSGNEPPNRSTYIVSTFKKWWWRLIFDSLTVSSNGDRVLGGDERNYRSAYAPANR